MSPSFLNMMATGLIYQRAWNGTPITRRAADGYVNATAMCKANGKKWNDFFRLDTTTRYLEALSETAGIPVVSMSGLVQAREGRNGGTWVHPDVATELARWISPEFSVFVNQWFREEVEKRIQGDRTPEPAPQPTSRALTPTDMLDVLERSSALLERFGGMDERTQLLVSDLVRNNLLRASGGLVLPMPEEDEELTISDAWMEVTESALPRGEGPAMGRYLAKLYREEFNEEPPTRTQYVDGAPRKVKSYRRSWLIPTMKKIWEKVQFIRSCETP